MGNRRFGALMCIFTVGSSENQRFISCICYIFCDMTHPSITRAKFQKRSTYLNGAISFQKGDSLHLNWHAEHYCATSLSIKA
ncbi:hypothetical protein AV530_014964 [Patagioenas fasciata monilis]|uniref:Uncharacterized protein n=1 Tax=Patagioenas fasciata monilis TaxID=372326 RepID=A0A1V4K0I7_PATFA|nr:hypothetical protein AV530_014964 [Patagioenas fasciata monilis]